MAEDKSQNSRVSVNSFQTGLFTDCDPVNQPEGTYRFLLTGVTETSDGKSGTRSDEMSNKLIDFLPEGNLYLGSRYFGDNDILIFSVNPTTKREDIGILKDGLKYESVVTTIDKFKFSITNQIEVIFRLRRGNEKVFYWVDGKNNARKFNLTKPYIHYTQAYSNYLKSGGDPDLYTQDKWDISSFELIKRVQKIPLFSNVEILETGSILSGSYNFAIQLIDADLNPSEVVNVSQPVNIFVDNKGTSFHNIRGSRNVETDAQSFPRANKSIKLTITNLDTTYPYYRIAIIQANGNTGEPNEVLLSDVISTSNNTFIYSGNDSHLAKGSLEEILIDNEPIESPNHIEQIENVCVLSNTKGKDINWCEFQKYASKISSNLVTKKVILNSIESEANIKNAKSTFMFGGYMPGEVYSFNIHYLIGDYISPGFHIPGKSASNTFSKMKVYESEQRYVDIHSCSTNNYWGVDVEGQPLVGKKVRHHRFPFRHEVDKPLFEKSTEPVNINRYRLSVSFTLNPSWVGDDPPDKFPVDDQGNPLVIDYGINYQVEGTTTAVTFNSILSSSEMGQNLVVYDDTIPLTQINPPDYGVLDSNSTLFTQWQIPGNNRFLVSYTYDEYTISSEIDTDQAEIFGIEFSNIEKPHPSVTGFIITRAERTEDDKIVIDNAIFGPMTQKDNYKSFGLINPKQYYPVSTCQIPTANSGKTVQYWDKGTWFFSPEHQFLNKKTDFTNVVISGRYDEDKMYLPTISNQDNSECNRGGAKGVYIDDVQAGTTYNPEVHKNKNKDDDGFDLIIGYKNMDFTFDKDFSVSLPQTERVLYLNAASYLNFGDNIFYNVSTDNKIGILHTKDSFNTDIFYNPATKKNHLLYGSITRDNVNSYTNFMTRPYYKTHNNPIFFEDNMVIDGVQIFGGDATISSLNFVSSVYHGMAEAKRSKKSRVWKIVTGAVLIAAAIALAIPSGGASLAVSALALSSTTATALTVMAINIGVSMISSGIRFEQFKRMIDKDYVQGLKDTVEDGVTFETIRDNLSNQDDTIRWFVDRASNIYIESSIPFALRSGLTTSITDFIDSPAPYDEEEFRTYITEKLTVLDRDQGSGRLYKGFSSSEIYDINKDYMRMNKEKMFFHLPFEYDCCAGREKFPLRNWYSTQSFQEERVDNYGVFLPNNYRDIQGEYGEITGTFKYGNNLFIQTKEALWQLPANVQERVTGEITSFIGTGSFFSIPPRLVLDSEEGSGGTKHKWANLKTDFGFLSVNEVERKIQLYEGNLVPISSKGEYAWFDNNLEMNLNREFRENLGIDYPFDNNPSNPYGIGFLSVFDSKLNRAIITKIDYSYLGDYKSLILDFSPEKEYNVGDRIFSEQGFFEIEGSEYENPIPVSTSGWVQRVSILAKPVLVSGATESSPDILQEGYVYSKNGDIIFTPFLSTDTGAIQYIEINMLSCNNDFIEVIVTD